MEKSSGVSGFFELEFFVGSVPAPLQPAKAQSNTRGNVRDMTHNNW